MAAQKFGITTAKSENFSEWFTQVVTRSELLDYYDIRGCFILRPASMFIWSQIRRYFDDRIGQMGIQECYFPMLVTKKNLELEKDHLKNFNPELAWITRCGDNVLDEPVALRPTSETIMYPSYAKWLKTYRDLPLRLNQWCSVLRWEVKSTLPFIRGREFLWQEGHTAYYDKADAEAEARRILDLYAEVYSELLAVPVIKGLKSKNETFGGAEYTLSIEAFVPGSGRGVQAATSHHLGQNFAKIFDIKVETDNPSDEKQFVYQNSWGLTTRSLGIAVMIHSDDRGFVCPPRVASTQVVIIPCGIKASTTAEAAAALLAYVDGVRRSLGEHLRVHVDARENVSPGFKYNHWEIRGVPLRIEIGFRDMEKRQVCVVRRDSGAKEQVGEATVKDDVLRIADAMHNDMYRKAQDEMTARTKHPASFEEFNAFLNSKCIVLAPWCMSPACEDSIGERTTVRENGEVVAMGAKSLCIPFDGPKCDGAVCINCGSAAKASTLFGRSY